MYWCMFHALLDILENQRRFYLLFIEGLSKTLRDKHKMVKNKTNNKSKRNAVFKTNSCIANPKTCPQHLFT